MIKLLSSICALTFAISSSAFAFEAMATVSGVAGKVLVNQGQGFVSLADAQDLKVGDQVFVGAESHVMVTYVAKACSVEISKPQTLTIGKAAPCRKGETVASLGETFVAPVNGGMMAGGLAAMDGTTMAIAGTVVLGAVVGGGILVVNNINKDKKSCVGAVSACP
jgi:hypothetical protein